MSEFEFQGKRVFVLGTDNAPGVLVMHEIPGLHPFVVDFGRRLAAEGYRVWMPSLFGTPCKPVSNLYSATSMVKACLSREFVCLAKGKSSPVTTWLRALAHELSECTDGSQVGAVGMCITGGFALALALEDCVVAPVMSQPALPCGRRCGRGRRRSGIWGCRRRTSRMSSPASTTRTSA